MRIVKFMIVGGSGAVLSLSLMFLFTELAGIFYLLSYFMTFIVAVTYNYILNSKWTFKDIHSRGAAYFVGGRVVTLGINEFILFVIVGRLGGHYLIGTFTAIMVSFALNYIYNRRFVWGKA